MVWRVYRIFRLYALAFGLARRSPQPKYARARRLHIGTDIFKWVGLRVLVLQWPTVLAPFGAATGLAREERETASPWEAV